MDILFVTWDGGGNVPPAVAVAEELRRRGHGVRFVGHAVQRSGLEAAGFAVEPSTHARRFTAADGVSPVTMVRTFGDRGLGRDALEALGRRPADLVVVDCMLIGAMEELRRSRTPYVLLEHMYDAYFRGPYLRGPIGIGMRLAGLRPRASLRAARGAVVTSLPALDPAGARPPTGATYVGPVTAGVPHEPGEPAVLVSLSTYGYPGMAGCLQRILDATSTLAARVVVTTGPQVDPTRLRTAANHEVHSYLPHDEVLPQVSLVVGHGGHGTTMKALAHDLPMVLMPMHPFVDQPMVAESVERAGAGRVVSRKAAADDLRPVIAAMLADGPHRGAAARLGSAIRAMPGAVYGADHLEELLRSPGAGRAAERGRRAARP